MAVHRSPIQSSEFQGVTELARLSFVLLSRLRLTIHLPPGIERLSPPKEQAAQPPGRPVAAGQLALLVQPSAGARRSRRERLYPASARPAKPMPSIAQVDGSGTAANSKSLEPVVNTTLPYVCGVMKDTRKPGSCVLSMLLKFE